MSDQPDTGLLEMTDDELRSRVDQYVWYHVIPVTDTITTKGLERPVRVQQLGLRMLRSLDVSGKRVLDVSCRDGLFSLEAEKLGAGEVVAIDNSLSVGAQEFLIPYLKSKVRMIEMNMLDLTPEEFGKFDIIIFVGTLYHLRYPIWCLKILFDMLADDGQIVIETALLTGDNHDALLFCPTGLESPYDYSSVSFFNLKGLTDTLASLGITVERHEFLMNLQGQARSKLDRLIDVMRDQSPRRQVDRAAVLCRKLNRDPHPGLSKSWNGIQRFDDWHLPVARDRLKIQ